MYFKNFSSFFNFASFCTMDYTLLLLFMKDYFHKVRVPEFFRGNLWLQKNIDNNYGGDQFRAQEVHISRQFDWDIVLIFWNPVFLTDETVHYAAANGLRKVVFNNNEKTLKLATHMVVIVVVFLIVFLVVTFCLISLSSLFLPVNTFIG